MPDKKLTDNEIKKALECCIKNNSPFYCELCEKCKFKEYGVTCQDKLGEYALDLINRLQAENERLYIALEKTQKTAKYWRYKCKELVGKNQ